MGRIAVQLGLVMAGALALAGCGFADSHASLPEFMRTKAVDPPPPEALPDVRQLVGKNLDSVFVASSNPRQVRVSPPLHEPTGPGWTACVTAELTSATGRPLGSQTYRITINDGVIMDRRLDDSCAAEKFQPI